ncbi:FtsX-like permease family protein [Halodesulfovibrio marinisediminis]|uniref:ABC-type antimicrobial peptide transport system, permease component n=1 Tax=Halodesulfovibrio marinisediminis DSM 17456 TaxID=1121457 RepID=A0A1N6HBN6_9BACT|nr:FtsX-like permease family protein [Halodesulfovibrio marinisediminis]SIO17166.1 ABC-type antimicrobial peptide transport system, permease component [Halodesulfovibrio marinisediminis DSM 17456]
MNSIFAIAPRKNTKQCLALFLVLCLLFCCAVQNSAAKISSDSASKFRKTTYALSLLHDRYTGSQGAKEAARFIHEHFKADFTNNDKVKTGIQSFLIPVTHFKIGTLKKNDTIPQQTVVLPPLRLNAVTPPTTPAKGITGQIIYVKGGDLSEFNGKDVQGAIVIMDLDSGKNWINAAQLGASALIYVDHINNKPPTKALFNDKFELTPINFPRFWISREKAVKLFGDLNTLYSQTMAQDRDIMVTVSANVQWVQAEGENVWAFIPGTGENADDNFMLIEAFYDTESFVPEHAPGADESTSIATLLSIAERLEKNPPKNSVLLLATSGHAQSNAGMRSFASLLTQPLDDIKKLSVTLKQKASDTRETVAILNNPDLLSTPESLSIYSPRECELLRLALESVSKTQVDLFTREVTRLRLAATGSKEDSDRIKELAAKRLELRNLVWLSSKQQAQRPIPPNELNLLRSLVALALAEQQERFADLVVRLRSVESKRLLKETIGKRTLQAGFGLYLSTHGTGIGGFTRGYLYELKQSVKRTSFFAPLSELITEQAKKLPNYDELWQDSLHPTPTKPWQSYLPDIPTFSGEVLALAGFPVLTLASLHDFRPLWGTPYDVLDAMDQNYALEQNEFVTSLIANLSNTSLPAITRGRNGFATLGGSVNLQRQGEPFPDKPAVGTLILAYQGPSRFYSMVNTDGSFELPGLATSQQTIHKAVIEAFKINPQTGLAVWAVDKPSTGKRNYRVKMRRNTMGTQLTMFDCAQSTLFNLLDARTLAYLYRTEIIDARTETSPLRYWYSRLDTRSSTLGTFFLEPDVPYKLTLSDTVLGKKVLLLNNSPEDPLGKGYLTSKWPVIPFTEYHAAKDMWTLLVPRIKNLEEKGIRNERIADLYRQAQAYGKQAKEYYTQKDWVGLLNVSRASLATASLVYNDIEGTQRDVLTGVLFYIALFIPFAYCLERLLFGFASIYKRISAFLGLLILTILIVYLVHPAFQLTYSPLVVILAFFIIGLSFLVSALIFLRFEREVKSFQQQAHNIRVSEAKKSAAFAAAMAIGVSNLRRRPLRTALTIITLTILTFTIMNFTSTKSIRTAGWVEFSKTAPYHGLLLKNPNWRDMPVEALQITNDLFGAEGLIAPRVWFEIEDKTRAPFLPMEYKDKQSSARALIGLAPTEPDMSSLCKHLVSGSWFEENDQHAIILPEDIAKQLGITHIGAIAPKITFWGIPYTVRGIIKNKALAKSKDLDGEPITPIIYPNMAASDLSDTEAEALTRGEDLLRYESRYEHISGARTVIIPARTLLAEGGALKAIAIKTGQNKPDDVNHGLLNIGYRFGMLIFSGTTSGTYLYYATNFISYSGLSTILIPIGIAILIVLNTMIGSVYERRSEIGVYTSVGLAPSHVAFLFVAESLAFAVISAVFGYLIAQTISGFMAGTALWAGMTANYSSTAGVMAMLLIIVVVLISSIYPSKMASEIAIPDVTRAWKLPEPEGDVMRIQLPFLVRASEQAFAGGFLFEYYHGHADISHGDFSTEKLTCSFLPPEDLVEKGLIPDAVQQDTAGDACLAFDFKAWLSPFDFGVRQHVQLIMCPSESHHGFKEIHVVITREAGEKRVWQNLNKPFLHGLRKQLLIWRSIEKSAREEYETDFKNALAAKGKDIPHTAMEDKGDSA